MNEAILTLFVLLFGSLTVSLSVVVCYMFWTIKRKAQNKAKLLASAFSLQLVGEFITGAGTLAFTTAAYTGILAGWPIELQSAIRITMFAANAITTTHLIFTIKHLEGR